MASGGEDSDHLAGFGYKQELERSLGKFSSFAAGFSYISILTGVFQLFAFGFAFAGPGVWWTWPVVFVGQFAVALCFAELAGQFPLAGSVYNWSKRVSGAFLSWMTGWIMVVGAIVTMAAVAVAWQVILPQISTSFQLVGGAADAGTYLTPDGARNAIILGAILIVFTTIVNMLGVKLMARINNVGVAIELVGASVLIVLLLLQAKRGPGVVTETLGLGADYDLGYLGALLVGGIMSAYVLYGFDTAGTLAEETENPRKNAPAAILRALAASALIGALLILFAMMAVNDINDENIGLLGLPYIIKQALGELTGDVFLACSAIAILVCALAVQTSCIRMLFAMARDGRLPFGSAVARVSGKARVPVLPAILTGVLALALLGVNIGNQGVFLTLTSVAIIMFYLAYLGVTAPLLIRRLRGEWPRPEHGSHFSLGRFGLPVNLFAVVYGTLVAINIAWPRAAVYNPPGIAGQHWYLQYGAVLFIGATLAVGSAYYFLVYRRKPVEVLAEHRSAVPVEPGASTAEPTA